MPSLTPKKQRAELRGQRAEHMALWFLRLKGYRLLAHRFKVGAGEVDLIMRRGRTTAFIEVKARANVDDAVAAVTFQQSKRIKAAARIWIARDQQAALDYCRFDIVAVTAYLWPHHIENAFPGDDEWR
jgi:putative endonuclease